MFAHIPLPYPLLSHDVHKRKYCVVCLFVHGGGEVNRRGVWGEQQAMYGIRLHVVVGEPP